MDLAVLIVTIAASVVTIVGFFASWPQIRHWFRASIPETKESLEIRSFLERLVTQYQAEHGRRRNLKAWLNLLLLNVKEQAILLSEVAAKKNELMQVAKSLQSEIQHMEVERKKLALALLSGEEERRLLLHREQELARQFALKQLQLSQIIIGLLQWNAEWDKRYGQHVKKWK